MLSLIEIKKRRGVFPDGEEIGPLLLDIAQQEQQKTEVADNPSASYEPTGISPILTLSQILTTKEGQNWFGSGTYSTEGAKIASATQATTDDALEPNLATAINLVSKAKHVSRVATQNSSYPHVESVEGKVLLNSKFTHGSRIWHMPITSNRKEKSENIYCFVRICLRKLWNQKGRNQGCQFPAGFFPPYSVAEITPLVKKQICLHSTSHQFFSNFERPMNVFQKTTYFRPRKAFIKLFTNIAEFNIHFAAFSLDFNSFFSKKKKLPYSTKQCENFFVSKNQCHFIRLFRWNCVKCVILLELLNFKACPNFLIGM